jgi:hypothetical protein
MIAEILLDFSKIKADFRKEIVREGTMFLDGQLKIATSADSRASGLAGIFTAAATALTAGIVITIFNAAGAPLRDKLPLMLGGAASAILFLIAAVLCIVALQPVGFWLPGLAPENWDTDVSSGRELDDCLGERAAHIQQQISGNMKTIEANARRFRWGSRLGIAAPFVGFVVWLLVLACRLST